MYTYIKATTVGYGVEEAMKALHAYGREQERENQDRTDQMTEIQLLLDIEDPMGEPASSSRWVG